jgi:hypothetical protein
MTIKEFTDKWAPIEEPHLKDVFTSDFFSVLENLVDHPYRSTAIEVLSDIEGAELILDTDDNIDCPSGRISFGPKGESIEKGTTIAYSLAYGQAEADWLLLMKCIAGQALKTMK